MHGNVSYQMQRWAWAFAQRAAQAWGSLCQEWHDFEHCSSDVVFQVLAKRKAAVSGLLERLYQDLK